MCPDPGRLPGATTCPNTAALSVRHPCPNAAASRRVRFANQGAGDHEFRSDNLVYGFEEKLSLSCLFQQLDNFLAKGLDDSIATSRENARRESAEQETEQAVLGKAFPQMGELALVRENNSAVIRELQRMQDDANYLPRGS
jgi:hypothetical protein